MRKNYQIVTYGCLCDDDVHEFCGQRRTFKIHSILMKHGYKKLTNKLRGCEIIRKWKNPITNKAIKEIHVCGS